MKIVIVTVNDSLYVPGTIARIVSGRRSDIVAIVTPRGKRGFTISLVQFVTRGLNFYGFRSFTVMGFIHLRRILLNKLRHILPVRSFYSTRAVAEYYSIPFYASQDVNDPGFMEMLSRELAPDVILSFHNPRIFKEDILRLPRLGCINVHPSLLPAYRGPAPHFWVLANNETETGVTVHYMDEKIDNGEIIMQARESIRPDDTVYSLLRRTMVIGADMALKVLERMEQGPVDVIPNDDKGASYYHPYPTIEDGRRLRKSGRRII